MIRPLPFSRSLIRRVAGLLVGGAGLALAPIGCTGNLNTTDAPLGESLPDLAGTMPSTVGNAIPADDPAPVAQRIDRSTWDRTVVVVERRQVEVQPWGVTNAQFDRSTARERGEYPTTTSVLEGPGDPGDAALEGLAAPFVASWDLVASPVRIFILPPWATVRVPASPPTLTRDTPSTPTAPAAAPAAPPASTPAS